MLVDTVRETGLDQAIAAALSPWPKPRAVHDRARTEVGRCLGAACRRTGDRGRDGVLVLAHSEKRDATATWEKTFGTTR